MGCGFGGFAGGFDCYLIWVCLLVVCLCFGYVWVVVCFVYCLLDIAGICWFCCVAFVIHCLKLNY